MPSAVYFLSDAHLGAEAPAREAAKERSLTAFLDARTPGETVYLLGDLFDFWFDDGRPPEGRHETVLGALERATDRGVRLLFMGGNHDYWVRDGGRPGWFEKALGIEVLEDPHLAVHHDRKLVLTHGDALGGARGMYRVVRSVLHNRIAIAAFGLLPRRARHALARLASATSRGRHDEELTARSAELLRTEAKRVLERGDADAVIAGHVHRPELLELERGTYLNLGDWMVFRSYGVLRSGELALESAHEEGLKPIPR